VKKYVHFTRDIKDFVLEKMHGGMSILEIATKFPDKVPVADKMYKASLKDEKFKQEVDDAYAVILMRKLDELFDLGDENWCRDRLDQFDGNYKLAFEARKTKVEISKFALGKMAPVLSKRFQKTDKLEVSGMEGSSVAIINYYADSPTTTISVDNKKLLREPLTAITEG
jgi:hypothetical protein